MPKKKLNKNSKKNDNQLKNSSNKSLFSRLLSSFALPFCPKFISFLASFIAISILLYKYDVSLIAWTLWFNLFITLNPHCSISISFSMLSMVVIRTWGHNLPISRTKDQPRTFWPKYIAMTNSLYCNLTVFSLNITTYWIRK